MDEARIALFWSVLVICSLRPPCAAYGVWGAGPANAVPVVRQKGATTDVHAQVGSDSHRVMPIIISHQSIRQVYNNHGCPLATSFAYINCLSMVAHSSASRSKPRFAAITQRREWV
ncbi:hypothetical protein EDD16DRAFT_1028955 [Pisolithus croceorrhizus]|nr:hypothetical protein EDD16DRAFT_1028955 [Pisolithus croceorrhizus]